MDLYSIGHSVSWTNTSHTIITQDTGALQNSSILSVCFPSYTYSSNTACQSKQHKSVCKWHNCNRPNFQQQGVSLQKRGWELLVMLHCLALSDLAWTRSWPRFWVFALGSPSHFQLNFWNPETWASLNTDWCWRFEVSTLQFSSDILLWPLIGSLTQFYALQIW